MPVKICCDIEDATTKMDKLRRTIKDGEGMTVEEVAGIINKSEAAVQNYGRRQGWFIKSRLQGTPRLVNLLVNPKTLALYAKQTARR